MALVSVSLKDSNGSSALVGGKMAPLGPIPMLPNNGKSGIEAGKLNRHLKCLLAQVSVSLTQDGSIEGLGAKTTGADSLEKSGRREAAGRLTCRESAPTCRRNRKVALGTTGSRPRRVSDSTVNKATSTPGARATSSGPSPRLHFPEWARWAASRPHPSHRPGGSRSPGSPSRPREDARRRPVGASPWQAGHRGGGCKVIVPTAPRWRPRAWAVVSTQVAPARETATSPPRALKD